MEIVQFKEFLIITGLSFLQAGVSVYVKTQAFVYISGRMLEILNKNRSRNILALVLTAIFTAGHMYSLSGGGAVYLQMWEYLDILKSYILLCSGWF
jgi:hypothetical protein